MDAIVQPMDAGFARKKALMTIATDAMARRYRIDRTGIHAFAALRAAAYSNSSAGKALTLLESPWFSLVMTQRSIQYSHHASAHRAARADAQGMRTALTGSAVVALASLVVVLITYLTGAG